MESIANDFTILNSNRTVPDFMQEVIDRKDDEDSFYVLNIGALIQQYDLWTKNLPTIKPFYAVKCNDTRMVMAILATMGTGFDCASMEEIKRALYAGVKPDDIIYANPSKPITHLRYAAEKGIKLMTFDSICEMDKIKEYFPDARLVLRLRADAVKSSIELGGKFGCEPEEAETLLEYSQKIGLTIVGLSFHVGTGCQETEAYARGILLAIHVMRLAKELGITMEYLDIGGGYPGDSTGAFEKIAASIRKTLEGQKETLHGIKLIAEPGRFFACRAFTLASSITSLKETDSHMAYYINNGIYGSFNCVPTEKTLLSPIPLNNKCTTVKKSVLWGQTTLETDKIVDECWLPIMNIGDWLYFDNMGAYSTSLSVTFHGFAIPRTYPIIFKEDWVQLKKTIDSNKLD